jgi:hypothetical protein
MHFKHWFAAWLTILAAPAALNAEPITAANWQRHPVIVEIRAIYREIKDAEAAGRLRKVERKWPETCEARPYDDTERVFYLDPRGTVRSYHVGGGSEDSAAQTAYYYDRAGALRFVFVKAGAVNGTAYEYRIYLSKTGARLWEERKLLKGPGYTFPSRLPDDWLFKDPKQAFHANPCPEQK